MCIPYDLMTVTPNTLKAHRLTWFSGKQGKATEMAVRILTAYFTEGQNIGSTETLVALAAEIGIEASQAKSFLESEARAFKKLKHWSNRGLLKEFGAFQRFALVKNCYLERNRYKFFSSFAKSRE